ncbi:MAG: hypothetical protein HKN08_01840 [Gammaproteobacteria bacterium]|nr:hypothetical protein [Gammaproteobacteria bacterium]
MMEQISKQQIIDLKQQENEFLKLVDLSKREDLAQCTKFLAMYIALYRQKFGEIPEAGYEKLMNSTKLDNELATIVEDGIIEATEMLKMVLLQHQETATEDNNSFYLN